MRSSLLAFLVPLLSIAVLACASSVSGTQEAANRRPVTVEPPARTATAPTDYAGLHNVVAYGDGIYSGSVPEGDAGFETLADMGIQTILSVDGALPEVDRAESRGMRYVHLPISYGDIDDKRKLEIARVVRDLPGPVYIHCHHGKHRSAGAAATASMGLGRLDNESALARMKVSGTAPNYKGLYACATDTKVATPEALASASAEIPSTWRSKGIVTLMVEVDEANDHLKAIEKAGWKTPKDSPDLVPAAEAGRLADILRSASEDPEARTGTDGFRTWLLAASAAAEKLETALTQESPAADLTAEMKKVAQCCEDCHAKYRD